MSLAMNKKMQTEALKMLGDFSNESITPLSAVTSATCTRVPVLDGHLVNVSLSLSENPSISEVIETWDTFRMPPEIADLPSSPPKPLQYLSQIDRPQIRRDRNAGNGMMASIGRLRECPILGYKFATLTHNTIRGAAGCSILNAELLAVKGYISEFQPQVVLEAI